MKGAQQALIHRIKTLYIALEQGWPTALAASGGVAGDLAIFNSRHHRSNTTRSSPATSSHSGRKNFCIIIFVVVLFIIFSQVNDDRPLFLPDPKDGSLYLLRGSDSEALKKLPFTIPQLVASSPCKSSDGILYTGKKLDTWFSVNPRTGVKHEVLSFDKVDRTCPLTDSDESILLGKTEYNILMFDSKSKEKQWNITFFDYASTAMESERVNSYDLVHFVASSTGHAMTLDRRLGSLMWEGDYGSPVIAMYLLENEGLTSVPFTSVADETLNHLLTRLTSEPSFGPEDIKLYTTLYIGEHRHGLYAFPSLVDTQTPTIAPGQIGGPLLLEGPRPMVGSLSEWKYGLPLPGNNMKLSPLNLELSLTFQSLPKL
uniref:Uncharacterized protein n=1 Tax=Timema shepardi TaxID=629360 RepID=A0A7R9AV48_TIMSH|nr:unnamed protein product [Timema shepardi]